MPLFSFGRRKIRPLKEVSSWRRNPVNTPSVHLWHGWKKIAIPLKNKDGLLQGVFETPDGQILEIRHLRKGAEARIGTKFIGNVDLGQSWRDVHFEHRNQGIGRELMAIAEREFPGRTFNEETRKKNGLLLLTSTGWIPTTEEGRREAAELREQVRKNPSMKLDVLLDSKKQWFCKKTIPALDQSNPKEWHRIKVARRFGKTGHYVFPVQSN